MEIVDPAQSDLESMRARRRRHRNRFRQNNRNAPAIGAPSATGINASATTSLGDLGAPNTPSIFSALRTPASGVGRTPSVFFGLKFSCTDSTSTCFGSACGPGTSASTPVTFGTRNHAYTPSPFGTAVTTAPAQSPAPAMGAPSATGIVASATTSLGSLSAPSTPFIFSELRTPAYGVGSTPSLFFGVKVNPTDSTSTSFGSTCGPGTSTSSPITFGTRNHAFAPSTFGLGATTAAPTQSSAPAIGAPWTNGIGVSATTSVGALGAPDTPSIFSALKTTASGMGSTPSVFFGVKVHSLYSDVEQRKSVFSRLARKRHIEACEEEPSQTIVHLTKNQPGDRSARQPRPIYNEQVVHDEEALYIEGLPSANADTVVDCALVVDEFESDTSVPLSDSALRSCEVCNASYKRGNRNSKLSIKLKRGYKKRPRSSLDGADELKEDKKKRRLVSRLPMVMNTEADPDSDGADGRVVDPSAAVSNLIAQFSETQIPFVNFKRRNVGSKLSIEPKRDGKKRRLIRPSLELVNENNHLQVGPMQVPNCFSESQTLFVNFNRRNVGSILGIEPKRDGKKRRLIRPSLELVNENNHLQVGPMQVANCFNEPLKNSSLVGTKSTLDGESTKLTDIMHVEAQGHSEGERVVLGSMVIETERAKLDLEMSSNAISSAPDFGQCRADINDILVFIESESNKLKQHFEESNKPLFRSEIEENSGFEGEAEYSNVNACLHNEKSYLVEECIAPEPKARYLETSLVSHKEKNSNPVKEDLTLEPEGNSLEMGLFSRQNNQPYEDYIPLGSYDEDSNDTVEYFEIKDRYFK